MLNMFKPFIPKDDQAIPDKVGCKITYLDGKEDELEIGWWATDNVWFRVATFNDEWKWIPLASIKKIEWDKSYSKWIAVQEKKAKEKAAKKSNA